MEERKTKASNRSYRSPSVMLGVMTVLVGSAKVYAGQEKVNPSRSEGKGQSTVDVAAADAPVTISLVPVPPPVETKWSVLYSYEVSAQEAVLHRGGQPVWFEVRLSDFDPKREGVLLKAYGAALDVSGFSTGLRGTLTGYQPDCSANPDLCQAQLGPGSGCPFPPTECPPTFVDTYRTDYVFYGWGVFDPLIDFPPYVWASTLLGYPKASWLTEYYLGTLVVWVPEDAKGTFTIGFLEQPSTALVNADNEFIPLDALIPGKLTVDSGACCDGLTGSCTNGVLQVDCQGPKQEWYLRQGCQDVACITVPAVTSWGLVAMTLLVLGAGAYVLKRRQVAA